MLSRPTGKLIFLNIRDWTGELQLFIGKKQVGEEDFELAEAIMQSSKFEFRTGQGFDVHRFESGDSVTLCGVQIPHTHKLKGHSDADVAMHALADADPDVADEGEEFVEGEPVD